MNIRYVPLEVAITPANGEAIVDSWWVSTDEGLAFYDHGKDISPQCNRDERVALHVKERIYPNANIVHVPVVFTASAMKYLRETNK